MPRWPQTDQLIATLGAPATAAQEQRVVQVSRELGANRHERSPSLTPAIGTTAAARDMDILRQLLGEDKLNFLGISLRLAAGAHIRRPIQPRVGRLVLDGVIDPAISNADLARGREWVPGSAREIHRRLPKAQGPSAPRRVRPLVSTRSTAGSPRSQLRRSRPGESSVEPNARGQRHRVEPLRRERWLAAAETGVGCWF